ncbi:MAG TPA: LacI family DNA-binding transcriptional regulator [Microlunatus sp.]|nr:LacI family DNA-binding transcriptional regulator [Microlunatus sp.]
MTEQNPTVSDVAARAGVAPSTVSNVLNNPQRVRAETRRRVEQAIDELGFVRNSAARGLRLGRTDTVGLVLADLTNSFFVDIARGAQIAAARSRLKLLIANSDTDRDDQDDYLRLFDREQVAGILLTPLDGSIDMARSLQQHGRPVILLNAPRREPELCCVMVDEALGGYIATRHLLDQGARRLAYVAGLLEYSAIGRRLSGARRAAAEVGVPLEVVQTPDLQLGSGRQAGRSLLAFGTVDGIVCASDPLAIGLIDAAGELGLAVPEDLMIVGYDDNHLAAESAVPVSSISQRGGHLAETAVGLLLEELDHPAKHAHRVIEIPPHLVARRSSLRHPSGTARIV